MSGNLNFDKKKSKNGRSTQVEVESSTGSKFGVRLIFCPFFVVGIHIYLMLVEQLHLCLDWVWRILSDFLIVHVVYWWHGYRHSFTGWKAIEHVLVKSYRYPLIKNYYTTSGDDQVMKCLSYDFEMLMKKCFSAIFLSSMDPTDRATYESLLTVSLFLRRLTPFWVGRTSTFSVLRPKLYSHEKVTSIAVLYFGRWVTSTFLVKLYFPLSHKMKNITFSATN